MSARPNWLKNSVTRKGEEGQALAAVMGLTAVMALLIVSVELSSIGQARLATITTSSEEALLAAEAGANDYQAWLAGSNNTWAYASAYCSNGVVWPISAPWSSTQCSAHPDPKNPAYVGALDQHCATDLSTTSGWELFKGSTSAGGQNEEFQYVVDSRQATPTGGFVHVFVTGRAGRSGHYACRTLKLAINSPGLQTLPNPPTLISPTSASCNGSTVPVPSAPVGSGAAYVEIEATGGSGEGGGNGGLTTGGGRGGSGQAVLGVFPYGGASALGSAPLFVNVGCQGGSSTGITQGGAGFNHGGSAVPSSAKGGGGGGSTAVCVNINPCVDTSAFVNTLGGINNNVLMIAGGAGGGGEAFFLASGGSGGNGGNAGNPAYTPGGAGQAGFFSNGGNGGSGSSYSCTSSCTGDGQSGTGGEGGGGGGGFNGGNGGSSGWSGGGGGGGSSYLSGQTGEGGSGFGVITSGTNKYQFDPAGAPKYGSVIVTWLNSSFAPVATPFSPNQCGTGDETSTQLPANSVITVTIAGGGGGNGDVSGIFGGTAGTGGAGTAITASYTTGSTPVWVSSVQGCAGVIGNLDGGDPGGLGLGNGGNNVPTGSPSGSGASGSGGGASALCFGTTQVNSNCGTGSATNTLLVSGGGGGASEQDTCNSANNGGSAGLGTNSPTSNATTGIVKGTTPGGGNGGNGGDNGSGAGPGGAGGTYSPNGSSGQYESSGPDSGGGGGGYDGGAGGTGGSDGFLCISSTAAGGGGGGSSFVNTGATGLSLTTTPAGTTPANEVTIGTCPPITAAAVDELCWTSNAAGNSGTVTVTQTAVTTPAGVVYEGPGSGNSTTW